MLGARLLGIKDWEDGGCNYRQKQQHRRGVGVRLLGISDGGDGRWRCRGVGSTSSGD